MRTIRLVAVVISCSSCATLGWDAKLDPTETYAACRAQSFLRENGYLDQPAASDRSRIRLELWDKLKYEKNGEIDWKALFDDRRGTFSDKLYALKRDDDDFVVVYRVGSRFSCVRVSASDLEYVKVNEANCKPKRSSLKLISEKALRCSTSAGSR